MSRLLEVNDSDNEFHARLQALINEQVGDCGEWALYCIRRNEDEGLGEVSQFSGPDADNTLVQAELVGFCLGLGVPEARARMELLGRVLPTLTNEQANAEASTEVIEAFLGALSSGISSAQSVGPL